MKKVYVFVVDKRFIACLLIMLILMTGLVTAFAKPNRIDNSEYGFKWHVYNQNLKKFKMIGIDEGKTVALFSNSKKVISEIGLKRKAIKNKYGEPIMYVVHNNICYEVGNNYSDLYLKKDNYIYFFYDKERVAGILKIKRTYFEDSLGNTERDLKSYEKESLDLINSTRVLHRLKKLKYDQKLSKFSLFRSEDMYMRGYFSHYTPEGKGPAEMARSRGIKFKILYENIARGNYNAITVFYAFMYSKSHRSVIMSKSKRIGTGFYGDIVTYIATR